MDAIELASQYTEHLRQLTERYAQELAVCSYDAVVIHSGASKKRTEFDDQYWPLRVTPHFQHWLPAARR